MTDRKREAIMILSNMYRCPDDPISDEAQVSWAAERLYARLAALREFPEEEIWRLISDIVYDTEFKMKGGIENYYLFKFKRLWQGQEAPMEPEPLIDHRPFKEAKGGCPECGGSGWGHRCSANDFRHGPASICALCSPSLDIKCPACNGTGERRKRQRRNNDVGRRNRRRDRRCFGLSDAEIYRNRNTGRRKISGERRKTSGDESRPTKEDK